MRQEASLTPAEIEIVKQSLDNPSLFTDYFFRPIGEEKGWKFDDNFDEEGKWQEQVHGASQRDISIIGGFATGKTLGIVMSAAVWCVCVSDFKFMNVAQKAWQAKQMYDALLLQARNTRFEDLIWEKPRKPHPKITIRYKIGPAVYESSMEFLSVDRDATGILSWEGDWLHIDEAGLLDNLEEIIINAGSRLRGTVRGRERLGRFSMTSNSWDNFYLWYYFDQALSDPDNFLSLVISSRHNHNVTSDQLKRMLSRIPEDERERFIDGTRPEGRGTFFSKEAIYECEFPHGAELVEEHIKQGHEGYKLEKIHGAGVVTYAVPALPMHSYLLLGDPGTGIVPYRNSYVLMVWDVSDMPALPGKLVAFKWGSGGGKIMPFVRNLLELMKVYKPIFTGIDSTSTQKNMNSLINEYALKEFFPDGVPPSLTRGIRGLDFSGPKKMGYLRACQLIIEGRLVTWPKDISGIRSQLTNYDYEGDNKIAQDIVACMCMSTHVMRMMFHVDVQALRDQINQSDDSVVDKTKRYSIRARTRRSARAHEAIRE